MMKNLSHFASLLALVFAFQVGMSDSLSAKEKNDKKDHNQKSDDEEHKVKKKKGENAYEKRVSGKGKGLNSKLGMIGFRLGANIASLSTNERKEDLITDTGASFGISAGLTLDRAIPGNDYIGIRVEGLFQQKSFNHKSPEGYGSMGSRVDSSTTLNFLEVPVLITLRFSKGKKIRPIAYFGGYGAALIAASGQQNNVTNADARLPFKTFDFGMVLGGGANFYLGKGAGLISTELRYSRGFANLADANILESTLKDHGFSKDPLANSTYNTNNFSLLVTYHF